jgi:GT2 family glycosyltransferase
MDKKIYVVMPHYIVTEDVKELAIDALKSFRKTSENIGKEIFIISMDDNSPLANDFPEIRELSDLYIRNEENQGFGPNCNIGFRWIIDNVKDNCYIICANNDIEVYDNWYEGLIKPFEMFERVGVTGMMSVMEKKDKDFRIMKMTKDGLCGDRMQDGGLWCSTKDILQEVGLFDERYKVGGYEDIDLFLTLRDKFNYKIVMNGMACYWHKQGATRWSMEGGQYRKCKDIEVDNLKEFINKWNFNPHTRQIWKETEIFRP